MAIVSLKHRTKMRIAWRQYEHTVHLDDADKQVFCRAVFGSWYFARVSERVIWDRMHLHFLFKKSKAQAKQTVDRNVVPTKPKF